MRLRVASFLLQTQIDLMNEWSRTLEATVDNRVRVYNKKPVLWNLGRYNFNPHE